MGWGWVGKGKGILKNNPSAGKREANIIPVSGI
jgi:hypothetical protein